MKNLFVFSVLFLGLTLFSIAQSNISLKFNPNKDGVIFTKEKDLFVAPLNIVGINSDAEMVNFKTKMLANSIVNHFETYPKANGQTEYKAILKLTSKDKATIITLLKSVDVTTLIVKNKSYTLDQYDQIGKDLKPVSKEKPKTVSGN